jgi:hypothetical protein
MPGLARAFVVRDLMGHSDIQTTKDHYAPESFSEMRRALDALSPHKGNVTTIGAKASWFSRAFHGETPKHRKMVG